MFQKKSSVKAAWTSLKGGFRAVAGFSFVLNLLMLAGPLYMLQVYDRVLTSQNVNTLIALSLLLGGVFIVTGALDLVRMRILNRLGARFELTVGEPLLKSAMQRRVQGQAGTNSNTVADVSGFRDFVSGSALVAFFDAPWIPIYLGVLYILHPLLGALGLAGAIVLTVLALFNNARSAGVMQDAFTARSRSDALFTTGERNAELVQAMGMKGDLARRWTALQLEANAHKTKASDRIASFTVISKTIRMALQSGMLGLGATLTIIGESTAGVMIAATIVLSRALAPIDQLIGQWRGFLAARGSYKTIKALAENFPEETQRLRFPRPHTSLDVDIVQAGPPRAKFATIGGVKFSLKAGEVVAVIGPSGSGKSTLAKLLTGIWHPQRGAIRLDNTPMAKWHAEDLGHMSGYLPQDIELFDGTIRENIARFATDVSDEKVLKAARAADVHDLISNLADGYDTHVGQDFHLSGGQRQRIALARAMYNDPFILVLDEPNSDLDSAGEQALKHAIENVKIRGGIVVVMTHRPSTLQAVDKVLIMNNGTQTKFGSKTDVLKPNTQNVVGGGRANPKKATAPAVLTQKGAGQ